MIVDRNTLALYLDLTPTRVGQLVKHEGMPRHSRGQYDAPACLQWYIDFRLQGPKGSSDVNDARRKLYDEQVVKTRLESDKMRRESIPADEHIADMQMFQSITEAALDGLGPPLAQDIADLTDASAISDRITLATNAIRETVADNINAYAATLDGDE